MANKAQKLLFNLSTMSPLVLIFAIVYWLEKDVKLFSEQEDKIQINVTAVALIMFISISVAFSFYSSWFVRACNKKLERIPIGVDGVVPNDTWVIVVLLSYALPAAGVVFKELNIYISIVVILLWILFLALSNTILPNPILMLQGYHFYKITTVDGSSDIILLSRRKSIQNRSAVNTVMIAFHYLAIEGENADV
ncbi:MAG: hypothetical protein E7564_08510 [Ruminococcaceae bacterium]|nr:hypothetical protein [Oscillospiraceae bacterium]